VAAQEIAVIIGAGPAGLTAALELIRRTSVRPIVIEASAEVGGICRTVNYKGFRMDIGGHRFFSRSDWVMNWWEDILPTQASNVEGETTISYRNRQRTVTVALTSGPNVHGDKVMLVRPRLSRIYFLRKFFDYPLKLNLRTVANLGPLRFARICTSYARATLFPRRPETSLEDFLVNRFGGELYRTFFKSYTEKVWGVPCDEISAEFGAQRVKGLSLTKAVLHTIRNAVSTGARPAQAVQTSLIERFLYPTLGPGQLWDEVASRVVNGGGELRFCEIVERLRIADGRVSEVVVRDLHSNRTITIPADYVISSMPVKDLVAGLDPLAPERVRSIAARLPYRAFITVGLLVTTMKTRNGADATGEARFPPDNWIYVQEPDVRLGRLQIFNNWSPALVPDPGKVWLGLEYFCEEGDDLWTLSDEEMRALAVRELAQIDLIDAADAIDATVVRVPKAYPAYFGSYSDFGEVRAHLDPVANLFLVGRNGMHRYNNQDHSMLTAKAAVDCIASGRTDKDALWSINVDDDYHEEK
jgi:protoporphyrinogen oxidase